MKSDKHQGNSSKEFIGGLIITFIIALSGFLLSSLPGVGIVGQMGSAILLAVVIRHFWGYPSVYHAGIDFSSKKLLRFAIILYGLKLNIGVLLAEGPILMAKDILIISVSIILMIWFAHRFKANKNVSFLLGIGTGICGAAAIAAVAPIIKPEEEETAISVGIIALIGTLFSIGYTFLKDLLPISAIDYGVWSGLSLHELAHVALAAAPAGEEALAMGLLAKLGRVFFLVPLCFILIWVYNRKQADEENKQKVAFPYFLLGFLLMSIIGSYVINVVIPVPDSVLDMISVFTTWLLTMAMVGLGLHIDLKSVRTKALTPLLGMIATSVFISVIAYFIL
ncbi:MAG: YeiH family protein [Bacillus sp. (in: firmicutes)]